LNTPRYSYRLCAESAINYGKYIDRCFSFVSQLNNEIAAKSLVRLSPVEYGLSLPMRWRDRFPLVKVDDGNSSVYSLMNKSRIVVQTYNQTGFLEALAMGIPTILLVDLIETPIRESAVPFYKELQRAGILHDTPESASAHVNSIWDDVESWWGSIDVRVVVARFTKQYSDVPENIVGRIESVLRDAMA
jgi:putative transferase (TIGR04331 family)